MANESLIESISSALKTSRRNVCIVSGATSRTKVVEVKGIPLEIVERIAEDARVV